MSEHRREVAVDRMQEIDLRSADAGDAHDARQSGGGGLDSFDDPDAGGVHRFLIGDEQHDALTVAVAGRPGRRVRVVDAVDLAQFGGGVLGLVAGDENLDRGQVAGGHTAAFERLQRVVGRSAVREGARRRKADLDAEEDTDQREERGQRGDRGDPPPAHDQRRPAAPRPARAVLVADLRPVDAWPDAAENRRRQGQRGQHAGQRDERAADSHAAHERHG